MIKLRNLTIDEQVLPAPMAGYTDRAFRDILRSVGTTLTFPGLVPSQGLVKNPQAILADINTETEPRPLGIQIFGNDPSIMRDAAQYLQEQGFSMIDINMGCPMKKIVKAGAGAALMQQSSLALSIISAVRNSITIPLTVKIRSGWDEHSINYLELGKAIADAGVDALCLHPRTREQMFHDRAEWSHIQNLKDAISIPLIGNGDVTTPEDALRMVNETGCDMVMVGRGIVGNPWLLKQSNALLLEGNYTHKSQELTYPERIALILEHYRLSVKYRGEHKGILEMRKHIARYLRSFHDARSIRQEVLTYTALGQVEAFFSRFAQQFSTEQS